MSTYEFCAAVEYWIFDAHRNSAQAALDRIAEELKKLHESAPDVFHTGRLCDLCGRAEELRRGQS